MLDGILAGNADNLLLGIVAAQASIPDVRAGQLLTEMV